MLSLSVNRRLRAAHAGQHQATGVVRRQSRPHCTVLQEIHYTHISVASCEGCSSCMQAWSDASAGPTALYCTILALYCRRCTKRISPQHSVKGVHHACRAAADDRGVRPQGCRAGHHWIDIWPGSGPDQWRHNLADCGRADFHAILWDRVQLLRW